MLSGSRVVAESVSHLAVDWTRLYLLCRYIVEEVLMRTRVQRWGNSLAIRIPKTFAGEAGLDENTPVHLSLADGKVVLEPVAEHGFTLDRLLANVTEENLHHEVVTGPSLGNEAW
jgi:antitoxin MazE